MLKDYRYIFIITYARSGSTLVQSLLNSAEGVQIRGENANAVYHLYRAYAALRDTRKQGYHPGVIAPDHPWFGASQVRPWRAMKRQLTAFVDEALTPEPGTIVTGFKEVRHIPFYMDGAQFQAYMDFLLEGFPDARIICNSRDAEKVCRSGFFRELNPDDVRRDVHAADGWFKTLCARSDRCLHMQYEEYTADPDKLRAMFAFAGLPYDPVRVRAVLDKPLTHAKNLKRS